jgi:hypothetical protein
MISSTFVALSDHCTFSIGARSVLNDVRRPCFGNRRLCPGACQGRLILPCKIAEHIRGKPHKYELIELDDCLVCRIIISCDDTRVINCVN